MRRTLLLLVSIKIIIITRKRKLRQPLLCDLIVLLFHTICAYVGPKCAEWDATTVACVLSSQENLLSGMHCYRSFQRAAFLWFFSIKESKQFGVRNWAPNGRRASGKWKIRRTKMKPDKNEVVFIWRQNDKMLYHGEHSFLESTKQRNQKGIKWNA